MKKDSPLNLITFYQQCLHNAMLPKSYMTSIYKEVIDQLQQLDPSTLEALHGLFRFECHPAATVLQCANDTITKLWLIRKGILSCQIDHPTRNLIYCFHFEGELVGHYINHIRSTLNSMSIESITEIECWSVNMDALIALRQKDSKLDALVECFVAAKYEWAETFNNKKIKSSAEELYRWLQLEYPLYFNLIPLQHIASYMGITASTLSHIRARFI